MAGQHARTNPGSAVGEVVGTCQLSRIQVGGYIYLTEDLQIKNLFVREVNNSERAIP